METLCYFTLQCGIQMLLFAGISELGYEIAPIGTTVVYAVMVEICQPK